MIDIAMVGRKIQELRRQSNLSQDELASRLFVTRQALSRWENGISFPTIDTLEKLTAIFGVSFEEILCLEENSSYDPEDIFRGHNRMAVVRDIVSGELIVPLGAVFYQFAPVERMIVLKAVKENRLSCDITDLWVRLTLAEQRYLGGNEDEIR